MERRGQDGIDICGDGSRISPKQGGSGETIDNPEIRLRRSNVSACGSGETIDNSEQQCSVCSRFLSKCMFSKRQLAKISVIARKCSFCLQEIARNGSKAVIFLESTR